MLILTVEPSELLREGLHLAGFDDRRQQSVCRATNLMRFQSFYGSNPLVYVAILEDLQMTDLPVHTIVVWISFRFMLTLYHRIFIPMTLCTCLQIQKSLKVVSTSYLFIYYLQTFYLICTSTLLCSVPRFRQKSSPTMLAFHPWSDRHPNLRDEPWPDAFLP